MCIRAFFKREKLKARFTKESLSKFMFMILNGNLLHSLIHLIQLITIILLKFYTSTSVFGV